MSRITLALGAATVFLAGGLAATLLTKPSAQFTEADIRAIAAEVVASTDTTSPTSPVLENTDVAQIDPATLHPMIESYLVTNPRILERMSTALQVELKVEEGEKARIALASMNAQIYEDADHVVLGNPDGDVTLVELFDYNCGFCRSSLPDMATLLAEDSNLKVILKEFPILSQESMGAARVAIAANRAGADYWAFHSALFTSRGQASSEKALAIVADQGFNPIEIGLDAESEEVGNIIQKSYDIAQSLGINGTPAYIIGNEIIAGAVGVDALRDKIKNLRACGKTTCDS